MKEAVRCDGCEAVAWRDVRYLCPPGWFYLMTTVGDGAHRDEVITYACSEACQLRNWQPGPGPEREPTVYISAGATLPPSGG